MGTVKATDIQRIDILRLEAEMNNLWGELNTSNIPNSLRVEIEQKLTSCEERFRAVLGGQASMDELKTTLHTCDQTLAMATIQQAQNEIPKGEHTSSHFLALENVRYELKEGHITPVKARHEVKQIVRPHT